MKISASYWMFEGGLEAKKPAQEAMAEAKELGFDGIELCIAAEGVLTHETPESRCRELVAAAKRIGIEISGLASGQSWFWSPTSSNLQMRTRIIEFTHKALQVANWLGTDEHRLLHWNRRGVLPALNFISNNGVRYFDREWAGEATTLPSSFGWRAQGKVTCLS